MPYDNKQVLKGIDFPSNSHKKKEVEAPRKLEKVVSGKVTVKKKSFGKKFMETFVGTDVNSVSDYVIHDVLIPSAKDMVLDMLHVMADMAKSTLEIAFFGESKGRGTNYTRRNKGKSYVSYDNASSSRRNSNSRDNRDRRDVSPRNRARHNFDDIVLDSRGEAEQVLNILVDEIVEYDHVKVSDLYDLVGITQDYPDHKWGWDDLRSATTSAVRGGGYRLNLPAPILLD